TSEIESMTVKRYEPNSSFSTLLHIDSFTAERILLDKYYLRSDITIASANIYDYKIELPRVSRTYVLTDVVFADDVKKEFMIPGQVSTACSDGGSYKLDGKTYHFDMQKNCYDY